ncbi:MAG TPA: hypothetical protein VIZ63_01885, partial [Povalibacter sp.]
MRRFIAGRFMAAIGLAVCVLVVRVYALADDEAPAGKAPADDTPLYQVKDGNKVDPKTLNGWKTWRALA